MSLYTIPSETLTGIANAIRQKTGGTAGIAPEEMAAEIASITTDPVLESKSVTILENGTVDLTPPEGVDGFNQVTIITAVTERCPHADVEPVWDVGAMLTAGLSWSSAAALDE